MKFTISKTELKLGAPPSGVTEVCEFLGALPDGELLPRAEVQARMQRSRSFIGTVKGHPMMDSYWVLATLHGTRMILFANPKTIAAYKKEFMI